MEEAIMRKLVIRTIPSKDIEVDLMMCDICETEIPPTELPIEYTAHNKGSTSRLFMGDLWKLFWKNKGKTLDYDPLVNVEGFDVHFTCVVKAIASAAKEKS